MQRQIEAVKRKAEQGSQQCQGEVQEPELESVLAAKFPADLVEPVPKGEFGGDIVHRVLNHAGQTCGTLLWESKRIKNWSDGWIAKLRQAGDGQYTKMGMVYEYLTGPRFRNRIEAMVEKFTDMQEDLDKERKTMTRLWAKREEQIHGGLDATAGMWGIFRELPARVLMKLKALRSRCFLRAMKHSKRSCLATQQSPFCSLIIVSDRSAFASKVNCPTRAAKR